jgi:hypothetical protein
VGNDLDMACGGFEVLTFPTVTSKVR